MKNYNIHLSELRKKANLSLKDAAKSSGVHRWKLYLYENGYFRPTKKDVQKLNTFYNTDISLQGEAAYPAPTKEKALKKEKENLKAKRIAFGAVSGGILLLILAGALMFNTSVNNTKSYYGTTYNEMRERVINNGDYGYDMVTSLKYYYVSEQPHGNDDATIVFYDTDNILYFNECSYSKTEGTIVNGEFGINRYRYELGSNLGVSSYYCKFNFGSVLTGSYFSCEFQYTGGPVTEIKNLKNLITASGDVSYDDAIKIVNSQIEDLGVSLSSLLSKYLEREVDFYQDFLPAREKGRKINFSLQITGLLLIIPGIITFFIFFSIFVKYMIRNIKPRLVDSEPKDYSQKKEPLPHDININFGIPDFFIVLLGRILQYGSMVLLIVAFIARLGVPFLSPFSNPILLTIFRLSILAGIFLEHFVMIGRIKKSTILFHEIIYNLGLFLFIATIETVVISLTNAWGYNFASLIYKYIPSNVYQVVAVHYLIFLFLFFQPAFLRKKGKVARAIWHSLSLIPFGFLVVTYFLSNGYALVYGVKENIFVNFWFPNGFLLLSIVCVIFLYLTFAIRLFYEKRFGQHNAQLFFYGDRYTIYENLICAGLIIIAAALDLIFKNNQYAYYLGLGDNTWLFALIPFVVLCRYSPNNQQIFLINEEMKELAREDN